MTTVRASVTAGSRSWSFRREVRRDAGVRAAVALTLAVTLLMLAAIALVLLPVHLVLRSAGKPGVLEASLER